MIINGFGGGGDDGAFMLRPNMTIWNNGTPYSGLTSGLQIYKATSYVPSHHANTQCIQFSPYTLHGEAILVVRELLNFSAIVGKTISVDVINYTSYSSWSEMKSHPSLLILNCRFGSAGVLYEQYTSSDISGAYYYNMDYISFYNYSAGIIDGVSAPNFTPSGATKTDWIYTLSYTVPSGLPNGYLAIGQLYSGSSVTVWMGANNIRISA